MEKLLKAVNSLKLYYGILTPSDDKTQKDVNLSPKDRQSGCILIVESLTSTSIKSNNDFPGLLAVSIETLLLACSDESADVRLSAEECLNRIIKGLYDISINKVLVELYKEIKKNSRARSLKAALTRFSDLCFNIRPAKCRPYILNLLPCLSHISQREEDSIQECLGIAIPKIFGNLGTFASESEIQGLIASFLKNTSHQSVTMRRTAGGCLHSIVMNSRNASAVLCPLIHAVLDILSQRGQDRSSILGCLQTLRTIMPLMMEPGNYDVRQYKTILIKVFEASIHYLCNKDHTIITASLELLEQLLKSFTSDFYHILLDNSSFLAPTFSVALDSISLPEDQHSTEVTRLDMGSSSGDSKSHLILGAPLQGSESEMNAHSETSLDKSLSLNDKNSINSIDTVSVNSDKVSLMSLNLLTSKDIYTLKSEETSDPQQLPFVTLARLLCQRFLLSQEPGLLIPDSKVRVSLKNLSLNCMALIVKMCPSILCLTLNLVQNPENQAVIADILKYCVHADPKLRGSALMIAAFFTDSVVRKYRAGIEELFENANKEFQGQFVKCPEIEHLVKMLITGLSDESSVCVRRACAAIAICYRTLCESMYYDHGLTLIQSVLSLKRNSYWLVKVDLLEILSSVNFRQIAHLETVRLLCLDGVVVKKYSIQQETLGIVLQCLSEDDIRIRKASSEALVAIVANYSLPKSVSKDVVSSEAFNCCYDELGLLLGNQDNAAKLSAQLTDLAADKSLLKTYRGFEYDTTVESIDESLSFVLSEVTTLLSQSRSKHLTFGCILSLKLLSTKYSPCNYPNAWGIYLIENEDISDRKKSENSTPNSSNLSLPMAPDSVQQLGVLPLLMGLLKSSWLPLDINAHCDLLVLTGNLLAGSASHGYKHLGPVTLNQTEKPNSSNPLPWNCIHDNAMASFASELYLHLIKLLSVAHHVINDITPAAPNKIVLPTLASNPNLPSPMKRKEKSKDSNDSLKTSPNMARKLLPSSPLPKPGQNKEAQDPEKEKLAKKSLGAFHQSRVHMKLYDMLVGAFRNYKGSLEFADNDKFCMFVRMTLDVTCQLMELASFQDIGMHTEEMLGYLKTLFVIEPTLTINCVQQLLKALFGTNLVSQLDSLDDTKNVKSSSLRTPTFGQDFRSAFSHQIFHQPLNHLTMAIANSSFHYCHQSEVSKENEGWFGSIKKRVEKKLNQSSKTSKGNKSSIQNYIRLFESLVIRSLKLYTVSSSVEFQRHVLNLLAQLVQLRVNYCMLDADQVFINFIIKQFESIESGMIRGSDTLVPHVFFFLVLLSYEKYHSKSVIAMPKIIQLCDGLMASGRGATSHVIPALEPIVHDLFVVRATSKQDIQEMTTQREVIQSMMLKLIQYPQRMHLKVFEMATTMLMHSRRDNTEHWKQLSRQVADVLLPLMDKLQVEVSCQKDISILHSLFEALSPTSLRPTDLLLQILLTCPSNMDSAETLHRWLCKILVLLRLLICNFKEHDILECIQRLTFRVKDFSRDRFRTLKKQNNSRKVITEENQSPTQVEQSPESILAAFFHQILGIISGELADGISNPTSTFNQKSKMFLCQELAELLLDITYMHRSGSFKRFTSASCELMNSNDEQRQIFSAQQIMDNFLTLLRVYPIATIIWVQYLTYLGHIDLSLWTILTGLSTTDKSTSTINKSIVSRGSVILLSDFACQNLQLSHLMSWLIDHHIDDIINLSHEPPVQDFISAVLQGTKCDLFIKPLANYCSKQQDIKVTFIQKVLNCLPLAHESCTGTRLSLLTSSSFIFSPLIAIAQSCDQLACNDVESLLVQEQSDVSKQLSIVQLESLLENFGSTYRQKRFGRLYNLLLRLKGHITGENTTTSINDVDISNVDTLFIPADKDWFKSILLSCCKNALWSPECAKALASSDYDEVMEVMQNEDFDTSYLSTCIAFGISEVISLTNEISPYSDDTTSAIMKASLNRLQHYTNLVIEKLPKDHTIHCYDETSEYSVKFDALCKEDCSWRESIFHLCSCLVKCFQANPVLPAQYKLSEQSYSQCIRLAVLSCEVVYWQLHSGTMPQLCHLTICLEAIQQTLSVDAVQDFFNEAKNASWVVCVTQTMYIVLQAYLREIPCQEPFLPQDKQSETLDSNRPVTSCVRAAQMLHLFRTESSINFSTIPNCLIGPLYNIVLQLSRTNLLNSYVRAPNLLWKYGWNPQAGGVAETEYPDIPTDFLQEKEILNDFVSIINHVGWTSRTQFEETWASLLGVLVSQPVGTNTEAGNENEDAVELSCLAIRGLTSLVIKCSLQPRGGQTATGQYTTYHRNQTLKLGNTGPGRQLMKVRAIINEELQAMIAIKSHHHSQQGYQNFSLHNSERSISQWLAYNTERVMTSSTNYYVGQFSIRCFRDLYGIVPLKDDSDNSSDGDSTTLQSSEYDNSFTNDDSDTSDMFESAKLSSSTSQQSRALSPLRVRDGVDVHSCVQFLLDLYTEWFRSASQSTSTFGSSTLNMSRPLLCECVRSLLLISDLFTERQQFEWMFATLATLHGSQPHDDDIMLQNIVVSLCKAGAVLGMGVNTTDVIMPVLELSLASPLVSCRLSSLYGALYCLECCPNKHMRPIVDALIEFVPTHFVSVSTSPSLYTEEYVVVLASVAFYLIEKCQDIVLPEFVSVIIQACVLILSAQDTSSTPSRVYHCVLHGLERLVLSFTLSSTECESVLKVAADQLQLNPVLSRATAACGLMLTCMYCGKMRVSLTDSTDPHGSTVEPEDAIESRLLAMERISLLFDRIRKGYAKDARLMIRVLPRVLDDFFPGQDIMNKVIAEFISTLQPFPDLIALVVHDVFQTLHSRDQSHLVQEWVLLSLSNVIQRTPLSTAVWCLTCLFVSASTNHWINSLLPVIISRMNRPDEQRDWTCLCKAALDFYTYQLSEELDRRSFHSIFSSSSNDGAYTLLLDCIAKINGEQGMLQ